MGALTTYTSYSILYDARRWHHKVIGARKILVQYACKIGNTFVNNLLVITPKKFTS